MMTSNRTVKRIELYMKKEMTNLESLKFEVDLLLNIELKKQYIEQLFVLKLVKHFHRNELKKTFDEIYVDLINDLKHPEFRYKINSIF